MITGISMGQETCQILGQVSHNLLYWKWSGERLTRKQLTSRPDHLWPELWKSMGKHAKLKEKQKWSNDKLHLENARKLRGIYFIDPEDKEFKETIKVFWKLMNLRDCVWEIHYQIIMKVNSKKEVIDEARTSGATVHFASLMDICHLKNAEVEAEHQKYKSRVVLRCDIVKDDSGSYAVFTEQGSSTSQMTAAKIMNIISRLPGCDGQAADAVSAKTQVKMEDAHKFLKIPKSECLDIWIRPPRHKWPKSWSSMEDPVILLERNLYGRPFGRTIMEKAI